MPHMLNEMTRILNIARCRLRSLQRWLLEEAYPLWAKRGWDPLLGGFHERLAGAGAVLSDSRRARVQLRQIYAFARASALGWSGNGRWLVVAGLDHVAARYRTDDGLVRALLAADGTVLEHRALLYDQAFALLALAEAHRLLGPGAALAAQAEALVRRIETRFGRPGRGFLSDADPRAAKPLLSNPHMHLLEAVLAWGGVGEAARWRPLADRLVALALERMIDGHSGAMREQFDEDWLPLPGFGGRLIEPGHQYEWAWLLLRYGGAEDRTAAAAERLIDIGERHGVRNGVAVNALLDDMTVHDAQARLWPQTERLKALALLARRSGEARDWRLAGEAAQALRRYLSAGRGLWFDRRMPDGEFIREPSPASSFYHIVCAIGELADALG